MLVCFVEVNYNIKIQEFILISSERYATLTFQTLLMCMITYYKGVSILSATFYYATTFVEISIGEGNEIMNISSPSMRTIICCDYFKLGSTPN